MKTPVSPATALLCLVTILYLGAALAFLSLQEQALQQHPEGLTLVSLHGRPFALPALRRGQVLFFYGKSSSSTNASH